MSSDSATSASLDLPVPAAALSRSPRIRGLRLHHLLFIAFTIMAGVPLAGLAIWADEASFQSQRDSAAGRDLLLARTMAANVSRYVRDTEAAFDLVFQSDALSHPVPGLADVLLGMNVTHICIIGPDGTTEASLRGLSSEPTWDLSPPLLLDLRTLASNAHGRAVLSNLYYDPAGSPVFYLLKQLPGGRLGAGIVTGTYLVTLQQSIGFGERGRAALLDAKGQAIAEPARNWIAVPRDMASVPVVAAVTQGRSGIGEFHSPALNEDMTASYASVPETGWGVLVSQPVSELRLRSGQIDRIAAIVALAAFSVAVLMAWLMAVSLAGPVSSIAATAEGVMAGNDEVAAPEFHGLVPREIRRLAAIFNTMLDGLRRRAAETRQALHQAELSNTAKSQFLANMSHEIRTPLNGVVGMIELLQLTDMSPPQRRYVETANQSSQALLRLVDDILDLSRIEVGRLELERAPFHLPSLVHDVRVLFADQARAKGLTLWTSVPDELNLMLIGDKHRLLQILTNLVGNALKFTSEGTITVRAALNQEVGDAVRIRFEVSDSGIGVPTQKQAMIFEPFNQVDSSTTRRYGGTGLGLSIARQLCLMMHGEIGVESVVGVGSTFWFTVMVQRGKDIAVPESVSKPVVPPLAAPAPRSPAVPAAAPVSASVPPPAAAALPFVSAASRDFQAALERGGRTAVSILLVEDNAANMRVTQALLESLGCRVTPARNGLEAVGTYREQRFDLVLMDCQMPEMDGYEATRAIRQIEGFQGRRTPIVALTAHAMPGSREASLESGMDDQITKPLTMAALTSKLLEWLIPVSTHPG